MKEINLSIIIPCYNEEKNIPPIIERLKGVLNKEEIEIILVDNGSKDNTNKIIKEYSKKFNNLRLAVVKENIGYGFGIFTGLKKAKGKFLCWTHADLQTDPNNCLEAYEIIKNQQNPEKSYIKGKRYGRPISDIFFTIGMSIFATLVLRRSFWDINAQPNLFHRFFLKLMKDPPLDFSFDLYSYYLARANKYSIMKFPVLFEKRRYGHSKWNFGFKSRLKFIKRTILFILNLKKYIKNAKDSS